MLMLVPLLQRMHNKENGENSQHLLATNCNTGMNWIWSKITRPLRHANFIALGVGCVEKVVTLVTKEARL